MSRATAKVDSVKESSSKSRILESSPNAIPKLDKPNTPKQTTAETNQNAMPDYEEMTLSELKVFKTNIAIG
jgi:hypothetical protein